MTRRIEGQFAITFDPSEAIAEIEALRSQITEASVAAWKVVAERLLFDSRVFVPVLTGDLLRSGRVEVEAITRPGTAPKVRVVFGSDLIVYAETQHEDPYNHPSLGFFGAAKYLERPWQLNQAYYLALWRLEFNRTLKRLSR